MDEVNKSGPYFETVSLCYFNGSDSLWRWTRVADIENGELIAFWYNPSDDYYYENRHTLPDYSSNPFVKGDLAVFAWSDSPNKNNADKVYTRVNDYRAFPIQVFTIPVQTPMQAIDALRNGVPMGNALHDVMYLFGEKRDTMTGILCSSDSIEQRGEKYYLKNDVAKVPYYLLSTDDILQVRELKAVSEVSSATFLKKITVESPTGYIQTKQSSDVVKDVILKSRMLTWNAFRDFTSNTDGSRKYTQKEWRVFKDCLAQVRDKSLQEELAAELGCTVSEATTYIENFIETANVYLGGDDVDTQLLSRLVMANDELREKYTALVEEKWKTDAAEKINIAAQKVEELEAQCKEKANTLETLNSDIGKNRSILQELQDEVARNTTLAQESYSIVQEKIATAKNDVSHFLAEMACYLPTSSVSACNSQSSNGYYFIGNEPQPEITNTYDDWKSLVGELKDNLNSAGIAQEYQYKFAAFLYTVYRENIPILLAGYASEEIGQAISLSIFAKYADVLTCTGKCDLQIVSDAFKGEGVLIIQNPFCETWLNALIQAAKTTNKLVIFIHPYTEDLIIEPQSLFNYILPVFTDRMTDRTPTIDNMFAAKLKTGIKDFNPRSKQRSEHIINNKVFLKLGISKVLQNKLQTLFAGTQAITGAKEDTFIYTDILSSYAEATGTGKQLCRVVEEQASISKEIKNALFQYFDYEEE